MREPLTSSRGRQIVAVGRELIEREGAEALTMRRLADVLGIRAPSLYKHLPDKASLEAAIIADGFEQAATAFEVATDGARDPLAAFVTAYRAFAAAHPHLYRLMTRDLCPGNDSRRGWRPAPPLRCCGRRAARHAPGPPGPSSTG